MDMERAPAVPEPSSYDQKQEALRPPGSPHWRGAVPEPEPEDVPAPAPGVLLLESEPARLAPWKAGAD